MQRYSLVIHHIDNTLIKLPKFTLRKMIKYTISCFTKQMSTLYSIQTQYGMFNNKILLRFIWIIIYTTCIFYEVLTDYMIISVSICVTSYYTIFLYDTNLQVLQIGSHKLGQDRYHF